jgi:glutaminase
MNRCGQLLLVALLLASCTACTTLGPAQAKPPAATPTQGERRTTDAAVDLEALREDLRSIHAEVRAAGGGEVYPSLAAEADADALGITVILGDGRSVTVGDHEARFPFMSVSKPFTYAVVIEQSGVETAVDKLGVEATGMPYNAMLALVGRPSALQNPLVNAGAIAAHSFVQGETSADKLDAVVGLYSRLAGRPLAVDPRWGTEPAPRSYALAYQMKHAGLLEGDPADALQRYLAACTVTVTLEDLAMMGATLATGGIQPASRERILEPDTVRTVLAVMTMAGMYEDSGIWWLRTGLPAKSGVSGAILAVAPGWGAIAAYSPRLDAAGNSLRAAAAIQALVQRQGLHGLGLPGD